MKNHDEKKKFDRMRRELNQHLQQLSGVEQSALLSEDATDALLLLGLMVRQCRKLLLASWKVQRLGITRAAPLLLRQVVQACAYIAHIGEAPNLACYWNEDANIDLRSYEFHSRFVFDEFDRTFVRFSAISPENQPLLRDCWNRWSGEAHAVVPRDILPGLDSEHLCCEVMDGSGPDMQVALQEILEIAEVVVWESKAAIEKVKMVCAAENVSQAI